MNPAALKTNVGELPAGGALIVNSDAFTQQNLNKAAYPSNPLTDGSLKQFTVFEVPISTLNERSLEGLEMTSKQKDLTKNFFALGLMFWLYERSMDPTLTWIDQKFGGRPVIAEANTRALKAGYAYGETTEMFHTTYRVPQAKLAPGLYRNITGNEATGPRLPDGVEARQAARCSTARTRSRRRRTSSTSCRATSTSASGRSRPRTRSRRSARRSARRTAARWR